MDYLPISTCYFEYLHGHLCNTMQQFHRTKLQNHTLSKAVSILEFPHNCFKQHNFVALCANDLDTPVSWDNYLQGLKKDG